MGINNSNQTGFMENKLSVIHAKLTDKEREYLESTTKEPKNFRKVCFSEALKNKKNVNIVSERLNEIADSTIEKMLEKINS